MYKGSVDKDTSVRASRKDIHHIEYMTEVSIRVSNSDLSLIELLIRAR